MQMIQKITTGIPFQNSQSWLTFFQAWIRPEVPVGQKPA